MNLGKMTYINKDGERVTDSSLIGREIGMTKTKIDKKIKEILVSEESFIIAHRGCRLQDSFIAKGDSFEITEKGMYILCLEIPTNTVTNKQRFYNFKRMLIQSFFMLRDEVHSQINRKGV